MDFSSILITMSFTIFRQLGGFLIPYNILFLFWMCSESVGFYSSHTCFRNLLLIMVCTSSSAFTEIETTFKKQIFMRELFIKLVIIRAHDDRLCGLVVRVPGYRSRDPVFDSRRYQIFWEVVGLERGPLSLVRIIEELLEWKSSGSGQENRINGRGDPLRWPRDTLYPQKLAQTSPTRGGLSVGIVRLRTKGHGVFLPQLERNNHSMNTKIF
jgi:hypothetical protein